MIIGEKYDVTCIKKIRNEENFSAFPSIRGIYDSLNTLVQYSYALYRKPGEPHDEMLSLTHEEERKKIHACNKFVINLARMESTSK